MSTAAKATPFNSEDFLSYWGADSNQPSLQGQCPVVSEKFPYYTHSVPHLIPSGENFNMFYRLNFILILHLR